MAVSTLIDLLGDKSVADYCREDAKAFVCFLQSKGNKTGTIRRRLVSLSAIFNYAYAELDLNKRNPFSRMIIRGEGDDRFKRGVFSNDQLKQGYDTALSSDNQTRLLMPLLGETGCRLAEVVGLRVADVDLENDLIHIRPNSARRLKTKSSERTLPLVDYASG
jgi:integrase